eukprot:SAG31_NODE_21_length_34109_cov_60.598824_20_plen_537_part_00
MRSGTTKVAAALFLAAALCIVVLQHASIDEANFAFHHLANRSTATSAVLSVDFVHKTEEKITLAKNNGDAQRAGSLRHGLSRLMALQGFSFLNDTLVKIRPATAADASVDIQDQIKTSNETTVDKTSGPREISPTKKQTQAQRSSSWSHSKARKAESGDNTKARREQTTNQKLHTKGRLTKNVAFVPFPHQSLQEFTTNETTIQGSWKPAAFGGGDAIILAAGKDTRFVTAGSKRQFHIFSTNDARECLKDRTVDFAGESYHKQTFVGLADILLGSTSNDENPNHIRARRKPPYVDEDAKAAQAALNDSGFANIRLICSLHPQCYGQTKGPPEDGAPGPHPRNHHAWLRMVQSTPELNSLEQCAKCLHSASADKSDALFVSANSHLLVSRDENFGKLVKTHSGKKVKMQRSVNAKFLALQDIKSLWNEFSNIVWVTGPGHAIAMASETQKALLGDAHSEFVAGQHISAQTWLDYVTCGPLYSSAGVNGPRPPCVDFHHMTAACQFENCSADGAHMSRFVNRMKAQILLNMLCKVEH